MMNPTQQILEALKDAETVLAEKSPNGQVLKTVRKALAAMQGVVLVPVEPSIEMIKAAWKSQYIFVGGSEVESEQLAERRVSDVKQLQQDKTAYTAMIAPYVNKEEG